MTISRIFRNLALCCAAVLLAADTTAVFDAETDVGETPKAGKVEFDRGILHQVARPVPPHPQRDEVHGLAIDKEPDGDAVALAGLPPR